MFGGSPDDWGYILEFLDDDDPRPVREQFHERYISGWHPAPAGLDFDVVSGILRYPGDPPLRATSVVIFGREVIALFPGSFVVIIQPDESWEAARMD